MNSREGTISFQMTESDTDGNPVLALSGRIRGEGDQHLRDKLEDLLQRKTPKIILDVSKADFIDSHGLGIIVYYHKVLQMENRKLIMVNANTDPQSYMDRLIQVTNLDKIIAYVKSVEAA